MCSPSDDTFLPWSTVTFGSETGLIVNAHQASARPRGALASPPGGGQCEVQAEALRAPGDEWFLGTCGLGDTWCGGVWPVGRGREAPFSAASTRVGDALACVRMIADAQERPGGNVSQPHILLDGDGNRYYVSGEFRGHLT